VRKQYAVIAAGDDRQALDEMRAAVVTQLDQRKAALTRAQDGERALLGRVQGELASLVAADQARRDAEAAARGRAATAARAAVPVVRSFGGWPPAPPGWAPMGGVWACIRQMESSDNYSSPGGGAYQFLDSTWHSLGQPGTASDAPPWVQDAMAVELQQRSGWGQWTTAPLCGR
jgi:hypothetical protein